MTQAFLPFERAFHAWIDRNGMGWERLMLPVDRGKDFTAAYRFTPEAAPRRIVVTLHGAGNDALFAWVGLFKRLLLESTEILTFDLPGHGRNNRTQFTARTAVEAIGEALSRCRIGGRDLPVHAVGVSLGGSVLLYSLPTLQRYLSSAVLLVAPLHINFSFRSVLAEVGRRTLQLVWREREHYGLTGLIPSFGPFKREIYPLRLHPPVPAGPFGYVDTLNEALSEMRLEEAASSVEVPVLLVYGGRDRIVPVQQGRRIAQSLQRSELFTVQPGTHLSTPLEPVATERLLAWIHTHG